MDAKTIELIAIGASVTSNCVPCYKYHYEKACAAGATEKEIQKAISVGRMVRKGSANKWDSEVGNIADLQNA